MARNRIRSEEIPDLLDEVSDEDMDLQLVEFMEEDESYVPSDSESDHLSVTSAESSSFELDDAVNNTSKTSDIYLSKTRMEENLLKF